MLYLNLLAMNLTHDISPSSERINSANNPIWMDGLRIILGVFLFVKGVLFLENTSDVFYIFSQNQDFISLKKASMITSGVHIVGGLMLAFGCLTRLAALCQMPVILGAMLIVNPQRGVSADNGALLLSILVFGLLVFLMIVGPGRYSVDNKLLRQKRIPDQA